MAKAFTVTDSSVNCYGVRVHSASLSVAQFERNPVMLWMHERGYVPGRWENLRLEGDTWQAEPVFDVADPRAADLARKVENDFIRACSACVDFDWSEVQMADDGVPVIFNGVLAEISLVDIPGNQNALRLRDQDGNEYKTSVALAAAVGKRFPRLTNQPPQMNLQPLRDALKLAADADEAAIIVAFGTLKAKADKADEYKTRLDQIEASTREAVKAEVEQAVKDGRLAASSKDAFLTLAAAKPEETRLALASLSKPVDLATAVQEAAKGSTTDLKKQEEDLKLYDTMDRNGGLEKLKKANPAEYERLFEAKWGRKPSK